MKYFTPEDVSLEFSETFKPRESTLDVIRQVAYTYRKNINQATCLN
ncbi:MAG: hypothetical protein J5931_09775 [Prevotella sp.]|jgi:hypothetical protein|nr:hypothetical protein [Prevotella sp.]MBQ8991295.1 hypothetical protein [Prevotella sp.]